MTRRNMITYLNSKQILGSESWMVHPKSGQNSVSIDMENNHNDMLPSSTYRRSNSQCSTISEASKNSALKYVYQRNKHQKQYAIATTSQSAIKKQSCGFSSAVSSDTKSLSFREDNTITESQLKNGLSNVHASVVSSRTLLSTGALSGLNHVCSSSSQIIGADSANINGNKTSECPHLLSTENQTGAVAEKDVCISYLRKHGLLGHGCIRTSGVGESTSGTCTSISCKTCRGREDTANLLICDDCGSAFHAWCCRPRVNDIPIEEWFCNSCEKKKQKVLKEMKLQKLQNITEGEPRNNPVDLSKVVLTCLDLMLLDTKPHKTELRIGKGFQADIPEWSERNPSDSDLVGEPLDICLSESERLHNTRSHNPARVSPIGNWLQCREVVCGIRKDIDGTMCGKWRRAPLSEVQTDDWDCFSSVHWDPAHADCAAPQELDTEEVMKQLKYIQMLKPASTGKRQKLSHPRRKAMQGSSKRARNP